MLHSCITTTTTTYTPHEAAAPAAPHNSIHSYPPPLPVPFHKHTYLPRHSVSQWVCLSSRWSRAAATVKEGKAVANIYIHLYIVTVYIEIESVVSVTSPLCFFYSLLFIWFFQCVVASLLDNLLTVTYKHVNVLDVKDRSLYCMCDVTLWCDCWWRK